MMNIFTLKSRWYLILWTILLGSLLFYIETNLDFLRFGIIRCSPGSYIYSFGSYNLNTICSDKGLLDNIITNNLLYTLAFWIIIAFVLLVSIRLIIYHSK